MSIRLRSVQTPANTAASWTPSPSPSPSPPPSPPLSLSDADRLHLLNSHPGLKPSSLPKDGTSPLLVLDPEELEELKRRQEDEEEDEEEDVPLWEEMANALLWTIPFGFLFSGMDYAVHAQFGQELVAGEEFKRLLSAVPTIYMLNFFSSRPKSVAILPPLALQLVILLISLTCGTAVVHVTQTESYLKVMRQAPGLGVIWVWTIVKLDLIPAVGALLGVAGVVWWRGEAGGVKWW